MNGYHPDSEPELTLIATCSLGFEEIVDAELLELGVGSRRPGRGSVEFGGSLADVYRACLGLRSAIRVLVRLAGGHVAGRQDLYDLATAVTWERWIGSDTTIRVDVAGRSAAFDNTAFAALVVKDAVVDRLRRIRGRRPNVDRADPDIVIHAHLGQGSVQLSLDASGEPLSHRGYRPRGGPAPLSESLAAGLLALAGYRGGQPLIDPMCGTGTIAIEAALIATATAPGLQRRFACERWADRDPALFERLRTEARGTRRAAEFPIRATDSDPRAVAATRANARAAGVEDCIEIARSDVRNLSLGSGGGWLVVANPPYGRRLSDPESVSLLYRELGDALKRGAAGSSAWLLVGDTSLVGAFGLRPSRRIKVFNGPIECRFVRFDVVSGRFGGMRRP